MANETDSKSKKSSLTAGLPSWVIMVGAVALVAVLALALTSRAPIAPEYTYQTANDLPANNPSSDSSMQAYNDTLFRLDYAPGNPHAGDTLTFTATIDPAYASRDWSKDFYYEIWIRQFGNWKITSCYSSPCSATYPQVSAGNLEYLIKRHMTSGDVIIEPASGSHVFTIVSATQTGDTLPPNNVSFHDPGTPHVGTQVSITASVSDVSGIDKVEIFVNDELKKTCPQKVKIAQCQVFLDGLSVGTYSYYSRAVDVKGNSGVSETGSFTVVP